jgi:hypothetical protein
MQFDTKNIISVTALAVLVYLVLHNGSQTNSVISALGQAYDGAVGTLQGNSTGASVGATV